MTIVYATGARNAVSQLTFAHLHVHSRFSFLEATADLAGLVGRAVDCGMEALALTDRDLLHGLIPFARLARERGLLPIAGLSLTLAEGGHLTLLARDRAGYRNLCRLSSRQQNRPAGAPRGLSLEELGRHRAGLILLTGGREGPLWSPAARGEVEELHRVIARLIEVAEPEGLYLEVQRLDRRDDPIVALLREAAQTLQVPLAATHEVRCLHPEEADLLRLLAALRTGRSMDDPRLTQEVPTPAHFLPPEEIAAQFSDLPEALRGTDEIVARCHDAIPAARAFLLADQGPGSEPAADRLRRRARAAADRRHGGDLPPELVQRLEAELAAVERLQAAPLVSILAEALAAAGQEGRSCLLDGPATGLLLFHLLGASPIDPLPYRLRWEFFLPPPAQSLPEITVGLARGQWEHFVALLRRLRGEQHLVGAGGHQVFSAREAWRSVARAYDLPAGRVATLGRLLPHRETERRDRPSRWEELLGQVQGQTETLALQGARALTGWPRRLLETPTGLALAPSPLAEEVPLAGAQGNLAVAQYSRRDLRFLGALIVQLVEEPALTLLEEAGRGAQGTLPRSADIPQRDERTAALLRRGRTLGCGRLDKPIMHRLLREVAPAGPDELIDLLALHRPVALRAGLVQAFLRRFQGEEEPPPLPGALARVVDETAGLLLYREQVWQLLREEMGYAPEEAWSFLHTLTRPVSQEERSRCWHALMGWFVQEEGLERKAVARLWERLYAAGRRAAPRFQAAREALLSWWLAYVKAHRPIAFLLALLAAAAGRYELPAYLLEARRLGLDVRPPHIHRSDREWTLEGGEGPSPTLWMGLAAVDGLSADTIEAILRQRARAPFASVEEFLARVQPSLEEAERLARVGALDDLEEDRLAVVREVRWQMRGPPGQMLLPLEFSEEAGAMPAEEVLAAEREILGAAVSVHPLDLFEERIAALPVVSSADLPNLRWGAVTVAGAVVRLETVRGEGGEEMGWLVLADRAGQVEVLLPGQLYRRLGKEIGPADVLLVRGQLRPDGALAGEPQVVAEEVEIWA